MNITIFRNPNDGFLNYIRSSDGKIFPLPLKEDIVKINEVFDTLQNATDYEITSINTSDNIPTYKLCCKLKYPNVFGSQGKKGATGPTGPTGPSGGAAQLFVNAIIVDAIYGDDTNAAQFTLMDSTNNASVHKFKTIDAAIASPLSVRYNVVVYPGSYTVINNLATGANSYYFYPGANVTCNIPFPSGLFVLDATHVGETNVYGYGDFSNENNAGASVVVGTMYEFGGSLNINCASITGFSTPIYLKDGAVAINVTGAINAVGDGSTIYFDDSSTAPGAIHNDVYIKAHILSSIHMVSGTNSIINSGNSIGWNGNALIECDILKGSAFNTSNLIYLGNVFPGPNLSHFKINVNQVIIQNKTTNSPIVYISFNTFTFTEININIYESDPADARRLIVCESNNGSSQTYINGDMYSAAGVVYESIGSNLNSSIYFNGKFESGTNAMVIAGNNKTYINGTVIAGGAGIGINKTTTTASGTILVIQDAKIITNSGLTISAPAGDTIKVIHSLAMNNVSSPAAASINSIVGSVCYTDSGVI